MEHPNDTKSNSITGRIFQQGGKSKKQLRNLQNNKSPGSDGIPEEIHKKEGEMIIEDLRKFYMEILRNENLPETSIQKQ